MPTVTTPIVHKCPLGNDNHESKKRPACTFIKQKQKRKEEKKKETFQVALMQTKTAIKKKKKTFEVMLICNYS